MEKTNIYMIGLGGIGSQLCEPICRYINYLENRDCYKLILIDGDAYEESNQTRQYISKFDIDGNKAEIQKKKMQTILPQLEIESKAIYINKRNMKDWFDVSVDNNIFLVGVDNNKTRNQIQKICNTLKNVLLLSGGNEYIDGDVQIFARKNNIDLTPPIWKYNKNILKPTDKSPDEVGCDELVESVPQLIFTNGMVANCMSMAFYKYYNMFADDDIEIDKSVIMFDIIELSVVSKKRKM